MKIKGKNIEREIVEVEVKKHESKANVYDWGNHCYKRTVYEDVENEGYYYVIYFGSIFEVKNYQFGNAEWWKLDHLYY